MMEGIFARMICLIIAKAWIEKSIKQRILAAGYREDSVANRNRLQDVRLETCRSVISCSGLLAIEMQASICALEFSEDELRRRMDEWGSHMSRLLLPSQTGTTHMSGGLMALDSPCYTSH